MATKIKSKAVKTMHSNETTTSQSPVAFQLKGSVFTLTIMQLIYTEITAIRTQLAELVEKTPRFFQNAPVVIDLQKVKKVEPPIDLSALQNLLREFQMIPVGVCGATPSLQQLAIATGLALLPTHKTEKTDAAEGTTDTVVDTTPVASSATVPGLPHVSKVITQPVRSGQQIHAKNGDLVVLAPVSAGSELLADGHIHVYGPLRGRALAGINGDVNARIFCQTLEAELVAIAGRYWISEDLNGRVNHKKAVQIYLEEGHLRMATLYMPGAFN